jgi:hypothetical protein
LANIVGSAMNGTGDGRSSLRGGKDALADKILAALPQLSEKQREIAWFILDNKHIVALASATEVGTRTHTNAASVVRFCQAVGYKGYVQLRTAIRQRVSSQWLAGLCLEKRLTSPIPENDLLTGAFGTDVHRAERSAVLADVFPGLRSRCNAAKDLNAIQEAQAVRARPIGMSDSELAPVTQRSDYPRVVLMDSALHSSLPVAAVSLSHGHTVTLSFGAQKQITQS